ncbi:S-layer homology domain-containing protein [Alkalihalophilus pseudofirmus]|uniref:S-layer homology domain-containing protein n=1 Tax=Alkalihalophilus pseudofirmus TaxID=79885 RepID=UPI00259B8700|nr:S-layer homology domain-containing protein [Alkalihalophilus pseudofirmus]WEG16627.1 S-layer homology domain-containing protein [Alkalihalophilus pseudofirmus]
MKKQLISIAAAAMLFSLVPMTQAAEPAFSDIEQSYSKKEIQALVEADIIAGYPDGTFGPKKEITRAEFARMLAHVLDLPANEPASNTFNDVPVWAAPEIGALVEAGVVYGLSEKTFGSNEHITREDMMTMIIRGIGYDDFATFLSQHSGFKDFNQISEYAYNQVGLASSIRLARGTEKGYFLPDESAERQAAVRWIYEIMFEAKQYERNLVELLIPRVYGGGNIVDIIWHENDKVEIQLFEQPTRVVELDELLEELHGTLQYFYLSRQYGHDWIEYSSEEKKEYVGKMVAFWEADYSFFRVTDNNEVLVPPLVTHLNSFFNEDNLYYSIGEKLENYALENGYIVRTE